MGGKEKEKPRPRTITQRNRQRNQQKQRERERGWGEREGGRREKDNNTEISGLKGTTSVNDSLFNLRT